MVPSSSGVKLWDESLEQWGDLEDAYLEEAHSYELSIPQGSEVSFLVQGIPMPLVKDKEGWKGVLTTPFQSGSITFSLLENQENHTIEQYVYPDQRKMTQIQFQTMLDDILKEAKICFELSGLATEISTSGQTREPSYLQWNYIQNYFLQLKRLFAEIERQPLKRLERETHYVKPEKLKEIRINTINWLERNGPAKGYTNETLPKIVMTHQSRETYDCYENRVLLGQLLELKRLLGVYATWNNNAIREKAEAYVRWIKYALKSPFLKEIKPHLGSKYISQSFRKQPFYRKWFDWFYALNEFKDYAFDWSYPLGLKDTYQIYEMWCFIQTVKCMRENQWLESTAELFVKRDELYFLSLAEGNSSKMRLNNGGSLYYQRKFNSRTTPYYTYTQEMIPDIVLEIDDGLIIFDPKYRVEHNLTHALAEMHQYRDGILHNITEDRAVKAVFILTPTDSNSKIFAEDYREKYKMGAVKLEPGQECHTFNEILKNSIKTRARQFF